MELHRSVSEYFHGAVTDALKSQHVEVAETTEFYLVNLLVEFTKTTGSLDEPLALKLVHAQEGSLDERVRALKDVGDTSLYMSGFFADSLARKLVDVDYYIAMGGSAYRQLSGLVTATRGSATDFFREVYDELAQKFPRFVDVLTEIRTKSNFASGGNLLRLYEEYVRTGSEWIEKRLKASGLIPPEVLGGDKKLSH
jgi:hypothetical protein